MTSSLENERKRRKKEKTIDPNRCEFIIVNKKRRCGMMRLKDQTLCLDHFKQTQKDDNPIQQERIPCPLDPKHSIWVKDLETHIKKCNARPAETHEEWYSQNFNTVLKSKQCDQSVAVNDNDTTESTSQESDDIDEKLLNKLTPALNRYGETLEPLEERIGRHPGLDSWVDAKENKKHILQQSSLASVLGDVELLSTENFYVEFGCGKGELSRTINACILSETDKETALELKTYGYGFIDRGANRMKMDNKIIKDCNDTGISPIIKRSRIDIEHLDIDKFLNLIEPSSVVGISKHLCGVATDLTLKCLLNSDTTLGNLKGLVVAMCCRHVCDYNQLLPESREYLREHGVSDSKMFNSLKKIVTWAVCGTMSGQENVNEKTDKERLGLLARTLIDNSRVHAVNQLMPEFSVKLINYADKGVTLENHCLQITRKANCKLNNNNLQ